MRVFPRISEAWSSAVLPKRRQELALVLEEAVVSNRAMFGLRLAIWTVWSDVSFGGALKYE